MGKYSVLRIRRGEGSDSDSEEGVVGENQLSTQGGQWPRGVFVPDVIIMGCTFPIEHGSRMVAWHHHHLHGRMAAAACLPAGHQRMHACFPNPDGALEALVVSSPLLRGMRLLK